MKGNVCCCPISSHYLQSFFLCMYYMKLMRLLLFLLAVSLVLQNTCPYGYAAKTSFSLAGCRVGYAVGNRELIDRLNGSNDAYPLARTAEAAAIASLEHLDKIRERVIFLKNQAGDFAKSLQNLDIKTYPAETFFFLGKVPMDADEFAKALSKKNINIRPIHLEGMENRFLKFAASTPENNRIVLDAIKDIFTNKAESISAQ